LHKVLFVGNVKEWKHPKAGSSELYRGFHVFR